jgi:TatD DNase family protein
MSQPNNEKFVDSHFHLMEMEKRGIDIHQLLESLFQESLVYGLDIGVDEKNWARRLELADRFSSLYITAGLSPACADDPCWRSIIEKIPEWASHPKAAAIGEIGLDWHWGYATRPEQMELFEKQLRLADELSLPVIVHNRNADEDIYRIVSGVKPGKGGVLHCFSSSYDFAARMMDLGFSISFAGNLTYKRSGELRAAAVKIPLANLLVETDSPYLAPLPMRGKTNHPGHIRYAYQLIAELRKISIPGLANAVAVNFKNLFGV